MGPTATGKTDLAAALTQCLPIELISVDAAQVYRRMNIGTAKPDGHFLTQYPHHLINIRDVWNEYTAADFCSDANKLISQIHARHRIPLFVGGSMFYYAALEHGLSTLPTSNKEVRFQALTEIDQKGLESIYAVLSQIDPDLMNTIRLSDTQRVQRAYEIYLLTGQPPSQLMNKKQPLTLPLIKLGLFHTERRYLHQLIEDRFDLMLEQGLQDEVLALLNSGLERDSMPARIVGYRQMIDYLDEKIDFDDMRNQAIASTRQLAKRQLTWMRNQSNLIWLPANKNKNCNNQISLTEQLIKEALCLM